MAKASDKAVKRLNLDMPDDLAAWVSFMSGMTDQSKIAYVCSALRRDMENAPQAVKDAFKAFMAARDVMQKKSTPRKRGANPWSCDAIPGRGCITQREDNREC